jgi:hypothetical protein
MKEQVEITVAVLIVQRYEFPYLPSNILLLLLLLLLSHVNTTIITTDDL